MEAAINTNSTCFNAVGDGVRQVPLIRTGRSSCLSDLCRDSELADCSAEQVLEEVAGYIDQVEIGAATGRVTHFTTPAQDWFKLRKCRAN